MTDAQAYAKGLEKLGLWKDEYCDLPMKPLDFYGDEAEREFYCPVHHEGGLGKDARHKVPLIDLRKDPAFAWRVLEAMPDLYKNKNHIYLHNDAGWHFTGNTVADALYAAVCALGRADS